MENLWVNQYVGIPFVANGRAIEGTDCWGLVWLIYKNQYGIPLPSLASEYQATSLEANAGFIKKQLDELPVYPIRNPEEGDIVLMKIFGFPCHVGIYLTGHLVLHSDPVGKGLSRIERIDSPRIVRMMEGFYRVRHAPNSDSIQTSFSSDS